VREEVGPTTDDTNTPPLLRHLERHLGTMAGGIGGETTGLPISICLFDQIPLRGSVAYVTLGLSGHRLDGAGRDGQDVRMELLAMLNAGPRARLFPAIVVDVVSDVLKSHRALLRGEVIGPRGPLWASSQLEALYVTAPVYFEDSFAKVAMGDGSECIIAWLVPITLREAAFVATHGWRRFEELLASEDPDLLDPERDEMVSICG